MGWFNRNKENGSSPDETLTALQEKLRTLVTKDNIEKLVKLLQNGDKLSKLSNKILYAFSLNVDQTPESESKKYIIIRADNTPPNHSYRIQFGANCEVKGIELDKRGYGSRTSEKPKNLLASNNGGDIRKAKKVLSGANKAISQLTKDDIAAPIAAVPKPERRRWRLRPGIK